MADSCDVLVAGHICLDIIPELPAGARLLPGHTVLSGAALFAPGGPVANTGLALHRLGLRPRLCARVGDDLFGQALRGLLERAGPGLDGGLLATPALPTSYTLVLSPPDADRTFIHAPGCNAHFSAADVPDAAISAARLLHFGYPQVMERIASSGGAELAALLQRARALGATTSLDLAMPDPSGPLGRADWRAVLANALPHTGICLPSAEELLLALRPDLHARLSARGTPLLDALDADLLDDLAGELLALGAPVAGLKLGHRGLFLRTGRAAALAAMGRAAPKDPAAWAERTIWSPCYAVDVRGTTGAGDATIAGFLLGLLRDMPPERAASAACAVGACCVEAADATSGVRSWPATAARLAAGWPQLPLDPAAPGWRWDEQARVWHRRAKELKN